MCTLKNMAVTAPHTVVVAVNSSLLPEVEIPPYLVDNAGCASAKKSAELISRLSIQGDGLSIKAVDLPAERLHPAALTAVYVDRYQRYIAESVALFAKFRLLRTGYQLRFRWTQRCS